jgi:hypothetical protein
MRGWMLAGTVAAVLWGSGPALLPAQTPTRTTQRPTRTEAEARARAERDRAERGRLRAETGKPVELLHDYAAYFIHPVPAWLEIDTTFYKKYVDALGIPVLSSEKVPDAALLVMRDIINAMLAARPDLRESMIRRNWRTGVFAETEMTMDLPEYAHFRCCGRTRDMPVEQQDRDYHANRSRGMGGNPTTGAEENLLGYPGTRYFGEHIFLHEFAHAIHSAIRDLDPTMAGEISAAYDSAMAAGKYITMRGARHYATTSAGEYWAEGVQWWFFSNYGECFTGNIKVETPEELRAYDPILFELIGRVFKTHRIEADVFHGRRIRAVTCPTAQ